MSKATIEIVKAGNGNRAIVTMGNDGQGAFAQKFTVYAYDNMAEGIARKAAEKLGWEIEQPITQDI